MKDETYLFISDSKEKKSVARSACKRVTHGGPVRLPSDYMTKKELNAMNGEVITYPMNDPLTWAEFKKLPDDIKCLYIKAVVQRYDVPIASIAEMFGVHHTHLRKELHRIGFAQENRGRRAWAKDDKEAFYAWAHCVPVQKEKAPEKPAEKPTEGETKPKARLVPGCGEMTFSGKADEALETILAILGGAEATITVSWNLLHKEADGGGE